MYFKSPFEHQHHAPEFNSARLHRTGEYFKRTRGDDGQKIPSKETLNEDLPADFFKSGNQTEIVNFLQNSSAENKHFQEKVSLLKEKYKVQLFEATFLTDQDWDALTAIELFDEQTLEHSIGTYLVAKEKLEKRLMALGQDIVHEGVILEQFYRACLLHDIGKIDIPDFVLNDKTDDHAWTMHFLELPEETQQMILNDNNLSIPHEIKDDAEAIAVFFAEKRFRTFEFVPYEQVLTPEQILVLKEKNIDCSKSLKNILAIHEKKSEEILKFLGYGIEAILAGNHHNYKYSDSEYGSKPKSLSTIHLSIRYAATILHLADIQEALSSDNRPYLHKKHLFEILGYIIDDAKKGVIDSSVAALWINDELEEMDSAERKEMETLHPHPGHHESITQRKTDFDMIKKFVSENLPKSN